MTTDETATFIDRIFEVPAPPEPPHTRLPTDPYEYIQESHTTRRGDTAPHPSSPLWDVAGVSPPDASPGFTDLDWRNVFPGFSSWRADDRGFLLAMTIISGGLLCFGALVANLWIIAGAGILLVLFMLSFEHETQLQRQWARGEDAEIDWARFRAGDVPGASPGEVDDE